MKVIPCPLAAAIGVLVLSLSVPAVAAPLPSRSTHWAGMAARLAFEHAPQRGRVIAASPVSSDARVASGYGTRAGRTSGEPTFHAGLDFAVARGAPVYATYTGKVVIVAHDVRGSRNGFTGYGNAVVIRHGALERWSLYAHLDELLVAEGQPVVAGQRIGRAGNTSNGRFPGMGTHLHFEVRVCTSSGEAPFPGPYGRYNRNPRQWLAKHGVVYGAHGKLRATENALAPAVEYAVVVQHLRLLGIPGPSAPQLVIERPRKDASYAPRHAWCRLSAALACQLPKRHLPVPIAM